MTEDEMVGWHHRLNGHEFEQVPEVGEEQGSLVCCSPRDCKASDTTEQQLNNMFLCTVEYANKIILTSSLKCREHFSSLFGKVDNVKYLWI